MAVLMNILFYIVLYDDFLDIGLKIYGDTFNIVSKPTLIFSILFFAIGTNYAFQIQRKRLNSK